MREIGEGNFGKVLLMTAKVRNCYLRHNFITKLVAMTFTELVM